MIKTRIIDARQIRYRHFEKAVFRKIMADTKPVEEFDDNGKPIVKDPDESGRSPTKIKSDEDTDIEPEDKPDGEGDKEPEVPVRKSVQQHIIARQQQTIKKLRSKQEDEVDDDTPLDNEDESLDEEITLEAKNIVAREVKKAVSPIIQSLANQADEAELQELFEIEPDAKAMSKQIRAYMRHPSYKGVPPTVIYHHLAFDKALGGAVQKKDNANREAKLHKGAGSTRRPKDSPTGDIPDVTDMDEKDFEELQHKARTGQFLK